MILIFAGLLLLALIVAIIGAIEDAWWAVLIGALVLAVTIFALVRRIRGEG